MVVVVVIVTIANVSLSIIKVIYLGVGGGEVIVPRQDDATNRHDKLEERCFIRQRLS